MNIAAETTALGKRYRRTWALRDCCLSIPAGRVTALVGPNGAGKTTLLSILAGLSAPTTGTVSVLGAPAGSPRSRLSVAFVAQDTPVYTDLRVRDHLRVARDLSHQWDQRLAGERLAALGITPGHKVGKLSGGQQAQLALTLALARRPGLLLLDEPLARLDPVARHDFLGSLVTACYEQGISVVFSSHVLPEMERIASYLIVLSGGSIQVAGQCDDLLAGHRMLTGPASQAGELAQRLGAISVQGGTRQSHLLVREVGDPPPGFQSREVTLEELILAYLRDQTSTALPGPGTLRAEAVTS
jgi:ABC-2 type transport system ATP-binding protein